MGDEPKGRVIDIRDQRRAMTTNERNMLEATSTIVATYREALQKEREAHENTRGEALVLRARIRELETELAIIDEELPTDRAVRSAEMRVANRTEEPDGEPH